MTRDELDIAIGWAEAEGWGPGRGDADAFWAADPEGFWALDLNDEMAACISAVHHAGGVVWTDIDSALAVCHLGGRQWNGVSEQSVVGHERTDQHILEPDDVLQQRQQLG